VLKAVKRLALLPGDNVLVAGQGPIGLMFTRILQLRGINVLATDLLEPRLQLARQFGAKWAVKPDQLQSPKPKVQSSKCKVSRRGAGDFGHGTLDIGLPSVFDAAILAVPSDAALHQAMQLVRGAGQILLFAHTKRASQSAVNPPPLAARPSPHPFAPGFFPLDLASVCVDEKDLIGSYSADFTLQKEVASLVFSRKLDVRPLISHRFDLYQAADAVNLAAKPTPESLKILVCPV
jgi:L-iditol 2-dehydrogenase